MSSLFLRRMLTFAVTVLTITLMLTAAALTLTAFTVTLTLTAFTVTLTLTTVLTVTQTAVTSAVILAALTVAAAQLIAWLTWLEIDTMLCSFYPSYYSLTCDSSFLLLGHRSLLPHQ